jgi:hypothetical protein
LIAVVTAVIGAGELHAQQTDTTRRPPAPARVQAQAVDTLRPPISPRRAFFYSFLAPGYSQSVLGRHKAASAFMLVEGIALVMIRESGADVHEARRIANDSVVVSYGDPANPASTEIVAPRFNSNYVHTREAHVEDWVALLVANHLLAGADAFVAAHLWDVGARLGMRLTPGGRALTASFRF